MCFSFSNSGSVVQWTLKFTFVCFPRGSWELLLGTCIQVDASTSKIHTEFLYITLLFEDSIYLLVYVILRLEMTAVKRLKYTVL